MPFVNVHIGKPIDEAVKDAVASMIAENMPIIPGKNRDNTMIEISGNRDMYMFGGKEEIIFVDIRVSGTIEYKIKEAFIAKLSGELERILGIPEKKQYFNILELPEWGIGSRYLTRK